MNRLKTIFISLYLPALALIAIAASYQVFQLGLDTPWLGALVTALPVLIFAISLKRYPHTGRHAALPILNVIVFMGAVFAVYNHYFKDSPSTLGLVLSLVAWVGLLAFTFWYSRYGRPLNDLLQVGKTLPFFSAEDADGTPRNSDEFIGTPALFMFYRGNWCPFCSAQVEQLTQHYKELSELAQVVLISPQPHDLTKRVADHYKVPFHFWVDPNCQAARGLSILHEEGVPYGLRAAGGGGDTVLPTVIIVDAEGEIVFTDQTDNYRVRPEPSLFVEILQQA